MTDDYSQATGRGKVRQHRGLHVVTLFMIGFSCLTYVQQFGTLNVDVNHSVSTPEKNENEDHSKEAATVSAVNEELETLKAKVATLEEDKRKLAIAKQGEIDDLRIQVGTMEKKKPQEMEGTSLREEMNKLKSQLEIAEQSKKEEANSFKRQNRNLRAKLNELEANKASSLEGAAQTNNGPHGWETDYIPLPELTRADERSECPEGLFHVDIISNLTADVSEGRKIPRIIHQTGETKCLTQPFYDNAVRWSMEGYSYYFHDAAAKRRLFQKYWLLFPQLQNSFECLKNAGGAAIADLWRYLVMWEYGGIYADMDDTRNGLLNETTITEDMDAFTLISGTGQLAQYFFSVAPKHPLMYFAVHDAMEQMHLLDDTGNFYVPRTTGPSCLQRAFLKFMGSKDRGQGTKGKDEKPDAKFWKFRHPPAGVHYGAVNGNRSVTVVRERGRSNEWVMFSHLHKSTKRNGWQQMNFTNYQLMNKEPSNKTCLQLILEAREPNFDAMKELQQRQR